MPADLLRATERGLYCEAGDFQIDPWMPVDRAIITHAHGAAFPAVEFQFPRARRSRRYPGFSSRHAGDPPGKLEIECVDAPHALHPFVLAYHPSSRADGYAPAGHVRPGVRLYGRGRQRKRLPCFVFGDDYAVMPAFGEFTGLAEIDPAHSADIYAVASEEIVRLR